MVCKEVVSIYFRVNCSVVMIKVEVRIGSAAFGAVDDSEGFAHSVIVEEVARFAHLA